MRIPNIAHKDNREQDLLKVDVQLRDTKDLFITCPPLSGLSTFLKQIQSHIRTSDHFSEYRTILFDCNNHNISPNLFDSLATFICNETGIESPHQGLFFNTTTEWQSFFTEIAKQNERCRNILIVDNLEKIPEMTTVALLENVRVIAESRSTNILLKNIVFILAGHSLDLRKLDPKHSSPFNTATQIQLDDLSPEDSMALVKHELTDKRYSVLVPEYIDFLTWGQTYLINQICYHIRNEETNSPKLVNFEFIDSVVDMISTEKRDPIFRNIDGALERLSPVSAEALRKLLNGSFYKSTKYPDAFKELRMLGLISNSRKSKWHVRNHLFDEHIRRHPKWADTLRKDNFIPRRVFVNVEGYRILFDLENNLREFVISQLFDAFGPNWEKTIENNSSVKETTVKWRSLKKETAGNSWVSHDELPSICYSLFPEIKKLIDAYWSIFEKYFKPRSIFDGSFEALETLRNKIAHNRPLSDNDIDWLASIAKQFNDCMYENSLQ